MTVVTGNIQDIGMAPLSGSLKARSAEFRASGDVLIAPEARTFPVVAGAVEADLLPGPVRVTISVGSHARETFDVIVPESGPVTLASLVEDAVEWSPQVVSQVAAHRAAAEAAALAAGQSATDAAGSATAASQSASAAAGSASDASGSAAAAKVTWRGAWVSGTAYTTRDVVGYGGSSWWALRPSTGVMPVEGADWSLLAARGEPGQAGPSSWSGITDKPTTFPPAAHQHTTADVAGLVTALASKADLDAGGKVPAAQLPALAVTEFLGEVASEAAMLALAGQPGDWCIRTDLVTTVVVVAEPTSSPASWKALTHPSDAVSSVAGRTGAVTLSRADVGLSNVDNTSDANKPISTAVSNALAGKAETNHSHAAEFARVAAAPATWYWTGTSLPTSASQVHAQARVGDMIVAPNLTTSPGWHQITGV